jgi:hypothetical protein
LTPVLYLQVLERLKTDPASLPLQQPGNNNGDPIRIAAELLPVLTQVISKDEFMLLL